MRFALRLCAAASAVALSLGAAHAATFDLTTGNGVNNGNGTFSFSEDGIGLTVSAGLFADVPNAVIVPGADNAVVVQTASGLGVSDNGDTTTDIDGFGDNDALIFAFDQTVKLEGVWFSNVDLDDDVDFFYEVGADLVRQPDLLNITLALDGLLDFAVYVGLFPTFDKAWLTATKFGFGADDAGLLGILADNFKIAKIKVSGIDAPEVPIPAAAPLFMAGLAGFGFAARRKRAAA